MPIIQIPINKKEYLELTNHIKILKKTFKPFQKLTKQEIYNLLIFKGLNTLSNPEINKDINTQKIDLLAQETFQQSLDMKIIIKI